MGNLDTLSVLFSKIMRPFMIDHQAPDLQVPQAALLGITKEADYIKAKRADAIAYLRSFTPSKYILDGAPTTWHAPIVLENFRRAQYQNVTTLSAQARRGNRAEGYRQGHSS